MGNGSQGVSWIHVADLANMLVNIIKSNTFQGVINATTSHPITNRDLVRNIAKILRKPCFFNTPSLLLKNSIRRTIYVINTRTMCYI